MYWYVLVHISMYWYVLVCTGTSTYKYIPVHTDLCGHMVSWFTPRRCHAATFCRPGKHGGWGSPSLSRRRGIFLMQAWRCGYGRGNRQIYGQHGETRTHWLRRPAQASAGSASACALDCRMHDTGRSFPGRYVLVHTSTYLYILTYNVHTKNNHFSGHFKVDVHTLYLQVCTSTYLSELAWQLKYFAIDRPTQSSQQDVFSWTSTFSSRAESAFPMGSAATANADGRRGSNVYEVNHWLWMFGRGKPRLGGLSVAEAAVRKRARHEDQVKRAVETRQHRKAAKASSNEECVCGWCLYQYVPVCTRMYQYVLAISEIWIFWN